MIRSSTARRSVNDAPSAADRRTTISSRSRSSRSRSTRSSSPLSSFKIALSRIGPVSQSSKRPPSSSGSCSGRQAHIAPVVPRPTARLRMRGIAIVGEFLVAARARCSAPGGASPRRAWVCPARVGLTGTPGAELLHPGGETRRGNDFLPQGHARRWSPTCTGRLMASRDRDDRARGTRRRRGTSAMPRSGSRGRVPHSGPPMRSTAGRTSGLCAGICTRPADVATELGHASEDVGGVFAAFAGAYVPGTGERCSAESGGICRESRRHLRETRQGHKCQTSFK